MIIFVDEKAQLEQLTDRYHRLEMTMVDGDHSLPSTPGNQWARETVLDWRARHPTTCPCWRKVRR